MTEWMAKTCIIFQEVAPASGTVRFQDNNVNFPGCNAHLGYFPDKTSSMNLQGKACRNKGLALHEIGHTIGLGHEHQRDDAEDFIEVVVDNLKPGSLSSNNFGKLKHSVLHENV